jgi:hypothetical protein
MGKELQVWYSTSTMDRSVGTLKNNQRLPYHLADPNLWLQRAACQAIWLRGLLAEITGREEERMMTKVDNKSAIDLMKNPVFHKKSKHINTRYHYIRECVEKNQIKVEHISGDQQRADILTKALPRLKFAEMREMLGVKIIEDKGK